MSKVALNNITGGYAAVDLLNENFDAIEAAFDNTLSRDGSTPNTWLANQDANHKRLLNLGDPIDDKDAVNKEYVINAVVDATPIAFNKAAYTVDQFTGDGVDTTFSLTQAPGLGTNTQTYINGAYQNKDTYAVNGTTLTFTEAPPLGSKIEVFVITPLAAEVNAASNITIADAGDYYTSDYVEGALQEVGNKLAQYVSVKDFGAIGDGVTDDTAAFNAVKEYLGGLGGGIASVPLGTYVLKDFDIDYQSVLFVGETSGYGYEVDTKSVRLVPADDATYVVRLKSRRGSLTYNAGAYSGLKNLQIQFAAGSTCQYGLFIDVGSTILEEVDIQDFPYGCVMANLVNSNRFTNCSFVRNTKNGFVVSESEAIGYMWADVPDVGTPPANNNTAFSMTGCLFRQNDFGMVLRSGVNVTFTNCVFESNDQAGLYVYRPDTSTVRAIAFRNCWFENNYQAYTSGSTSYSVTGNNAFLIGNSSTYIAWTSAYQAGYQVVIDSQTHAGGGPDTFEFNQSFLSCNTSDQKALFIISCFKFTFNQCIFNGGDTVNLIKAANPTAQAICFIDPLANNNPTLTIPSLVSGNGMGTAGVYLRTGTTYDGTPALSGGLYPVVGVTGGPVRFPEPDPADPRLTDDRTMNEYYQGTFAPSFTNLGGSGFSAAGYFTKIGNRVFFTLEITGTNITSTVGSTTFNLHTLPVPYKNGLLSAVNNSTSATSYGNGWINSTTSTFYLPSWSATSSVLVSGSYQTEY